jgi:alkylation response protein AidB-like acyl-CoA dehydrogenase
MRDARITPIYEGTNGIQALDLLGRKVFGTGGKSVQMMVARIKEAIDKYAALPEVTPLAVELGKRLEQWGRLTAELGKAAMANPEEVGAAATDYLQVSGYVCLGWCWLAAAGVAAKKIAAGDAEADFYRAKLVTAQHYFDRILPRIDSHAAAARAGAAGLMKLPAEHFAFA